MMRPKSLTSRIIKNDVQNEEKFSQLLSREEEAEVSNAIRKLRSAIRVRDDLVSNHMNPEDSEFPWQPTETEWALACGMSVMQLRRVMNDGRDARIKLVDANGGLVNSIAKKHFYSVKQANQAGGGLGSILTLQDMIQEGNLGLMEAAERFEPERGNRFSTYATYWIDGRILRSISEYSRIIRLPAHGEFDLFYSISVCLPLPSSVVLTSPCLWDFSSPNRQKDSQG
jgi:DNA-directed RNA polymerase sigma subunit (sigma70/sigma32)